MRVECRILRTKNRVEAYLAGNEGDMVIVCTAAGTKAAAYKQVCQQAADKLRRLAAIYDVAADTVDIQKYAVQTRLNREARDADTND